MRSLKLCLRVVKGLSIDVHVVRHHRFKWCMTHENSHPGRLKKQDVAFLQAAGQRGDINPHQHTSVCATHTFDLELTLEEKLLYFLVSLATADAHVSICAPLLKCVRCQNVDVCCQWRQV